MCSFSLDVLASIHLDAELERDRSDLYLQLLIWFIQALKLMGHLTPQQEAKVTLVSVEQSI